MQRIYHLSSTWICYLGTNPKYLDLEFKKTGHQNVYMPLVIPKVFSKRKDHVEGFAPETAMVTTTGVEDLAERLIIRPTSEVLFGTHYSKIIQLIETYQRNITNGVQWYVGKRILVHSYEARILMARRTYCSCNC